MTQSKMFYSTPEVDIFAADTASKTTAPLFESPVSAGFPSPAEDFVELSLDLNAYIVKHPAATFYVRVKGSSMKDAGIHEGDVLVVDRSLEPRDANIVIGLINGEFTVKRIRKIKTDLFLVPENPNYKPIKITSDHDFQIWGIVSYVIHKV
jgi:DNA polymerase V